MSRQKYDWESIAREYRANQLSIREISRKYGPGESSIRKRAKAEGWERDLSKAVRRKTRDKVVRSSVRTPDAGESTAHDEQEIIEEAASRGAAVVESHRRDINQARNTAGLLMAELRDGTENAQLVSEVVDQLADEEGMTQKAKAAAHRAISLPQRAGVMRDLATAMTKLQSLERQAFGLDDEGGEEDYEDQLMRLANEDE